VTTGNKNNTLTPEQIADGINDGSLPKTTPGANFSPNISDDDVTEFDTRAKGLDAPAKSPLQVVLENPGDATFASMLEDFAGADTLLGSAQSTAWQHIAGNMLDAFTEFQQGLATLEDQGGWVGKTHDAAKANITQSFAQLTTLIGGINSQSALLDSFGRTVFQTQWYFKNWDPEYQEDLAKWPNEADQVNQGFDSFAQKVITTVYQPNIQEIAQQNPGFTSAQQMSVGDIPTTPTTPNDPTGSPSGGDGPTPSAPNFNAPSTAGGGGPNGSNSPAIPNMDSVTGAPGNVGSALTSPVGGFDGAGSTAGFDPSQLPGAASIRAASPTGAPTDGFDPSQLPGAGSIGAGSTGAGSIGALTSTGAPTDGFDPSQLPGAGSIGAGSVGALTPTGAPSDGIDPSQFPGATNIGAPDPSQVDPFSSSDPNGAALLTNPSGTPTVPGDNPVDSSGLSGLGNLGSGLSGVGSSSGGGLSGVGSPSGSGLSGVGSSSGGGPAGAASGASGLGSQLGSAVGPAADALKQATSAGQPPGGMPDLDPKNFNAANGADPDGAHAGGGGGAGIGGRGLDPSRPGGVPVANATRGPALAGAPRLGVPGGEAAGAGGSGAGAPPGGGGGQRGPAGKEHKANKALRRKRNGELVIGEPDAVVPVIGDDGADTDGKEPSVPPTTPPLTAPPARRSAPAASARRPGAEQLRAELDL